MKCLGGRKKEINCMKEPKFNEVIKIQSKQCSEMITLEYTQI